MFQIRIAVIYEGEIVGILETAKTNEQEIGLLMAGAGREEVSSNEKN